MTVGLKFTESKKVMRQIYVAFFLLSIFAPIFVTSGFAAPQIEVTVDSAKAIDTNYLSLGIELTSDVYRFRSTSTLRGLARDADFKLVRFINNKIEPCSSWRESSKTGTFNWAAVDNLVEGIFEIGAEPFICLGFYNWNRDTLEKPRGMTDNPATGLPYPDQWAAYCAEWVKHFKTVGLPVRYYEIVNEAFFYFGWTPTQPKLSYYMDLYNAAAIAMRAANPNVQIGCDESNKKAVLDYFISNGEDLDFISFHRYGASTLSASDREILSAAETKYIDDSSAKYGLDTARQVYKKAKGVDLPVIMSEGNMNSGYTSGTDPRTRQMLGAVYWALSIRTFILKDLMYTVYHNFGSYGLDGVGMVNLDDNEPWYPYYAHQMIGNNLAVGDTIVESTSSSDDVRSLAWIHDKTLNILLICKVDEAKTVYLNGLAGQLNYLKIDNTISWRTPRVQTDTIASTQPLTMNGYAVAIVQADISSLPPSPPPPGPSPPPPRPPSEFDFEDDFESGDFSEWTGTSTSTGETARVVDWRPYQGTFHGRFTSNGGAGTEYAFCYKAIDAEEVYARGYFNVPSGLPLTDNDDQFYFMDIRAGSQSLARVGIRRNGGVDKWALYTRDGSSFVGPTYATSPTIERNNWYSIELHWKQHTTQGLVEAYVDGAKILEIANIDTTYFGNADEVDFGLISATNVQNNLYIYGDNFAANTYTNSNGEEGSGVFGNTNEGISQTNLASFAYGSRYQILENGIAQNISIRVWERDGEDRIAEVAIYDDDGGVPNSLLALGSGIIQAGTNGWVTIDLTTHPNLSAGNYYWLVANAITSGDTVRFYYDAGTPNQAIYSSLSLASFPADPCHISGYRDRAYSINCGYTT